MIGVGIVISAVAAGCFAAAVCQGKHIGAPFNNAYLYATQKEREAMDVAPLFRQSAIVFSLLGGVFTFTALACLSDIAWFYSGTGVCLIAALVYAIVSTVRMQRK